MRVKMKKIKLRMEVKKKMYNTFLIEDIPFFAPDKWDESLDFVYDGITVMGYDILRKNLLTYFSHRSFDIPSWFYKLYPSYYDSVGNLTDSTGAIKKYFTVLYNNFLANRGYDYNMELKAIRGIYEPLDDFDKKTDTTIANTGSDITSDSGSDIKTDAIDQTTTDSSTSTTVGSATDTTTYGSTDTVGITDTTTNSVTGFNNVSDFNNADKSVKVSDTADAKTGTDKVENTSSSTTSNAGSGEQKATNTETLAHGHTQTTQHGHKIETSVHEYGNIGIKTHQTLIQEEINLRKNRLYMNICLDFVESFSWF